ncbi:hypothetical protein ACFL1M_02150 [Patescibacteria group bacterium]
MVAYKVPEHVSLILQNTYDHIVGRSLPVANLHISLTFPFFLKDTHDEGWLKNRVNDLLMKSIDAWTTIVDVYSQKNKLLYVQVEPVDRFRKNNTNLSTILRQGTVFDVSPYINNELPTYSSHISLDYDFDENELVLHSLRKEIVELQFNTGEPTVVRFDENLFEEI